VVQHYNALFVYFILFIYLFKRHNIAQVRKTMNTTVLNQIPAKIIDIA